MCVGGGSRVDLIILSCFGGRRAILFFCYCLTVGVLSLCLFLVVPGWPVIVALPTCADPEGVDRGPDPMKNHKNIGFLSNTGRDPMENHKATKPAFNVGPSSARQRNAI